MVLSLLLWVCVSNMHSIILVEGLGAKLKMGSKSSKRPWNGDIDMKDIREYWMISHVYVRKELLFYTLFYS
jgi:hypothetical protein